MSRITRRSLIGTAAATSTLAMIPAGAALAQEATPMTGEDTEPRYGTVRIRREPTAELQRAVFPDVMLSLVAPSMQIPGYLGYTFAFDNDDPATAIVFSTMTNEEAALESQAVAQEYVAQLDPRFATETPLVSEGPVRLYAQTDRPATELPPFLYGTALTVREIADAPDIDIDEVIQIAQDGLIPIFLNQPGFILYCLFTTPGGRIAINIWDSPEDQAAGAEVLEAFRGGAFASPIDAERTDYNGTIAYSTIAGLI